MILCSQVLLSKLCLDTGPKSEAFSVGTTMVSSAASYLVSKVLPFPKTTNPISQPASTHSLTHSFIHPTSTHGAFTIPRAGVPWRKTAPWFSR